MRARSEPSCWVPWREAADHERETEHQQQVGQDRADQGRAHDVHEAGLEREDADEQLRQVAQRRLQDAGGARPEPVAELLDGPADERRQERDRRRRDDEGGDGVPAAVVGEPGEHAQRRRATDDHLVGRDECGRRGGGAHAHHRSGHRRTTVSAAAVGGLDYARPEHTRTRKGRGVYTTTGVFVCFEGGEGAGKSTQSRALASTLEPRGYHVLLTFEPGDTAVGKEVRRIVLDPATGELSDRTEVLLYAADKAEHVDTVVLPALERGEVVITDRYVDSLARLPGRRAHPRRRRGRAGRPLGHPRPASPPDRRARPRPGARLRPVRRARPDRGGVARVPPSGCGRRSSTWPRPTPTTTSCSTRGARPTRSRPRCGSGSSPCSVRRRDDDDRHRPSVWDSLVGQRRVIEALRTAASGHGMSQAFLFIGPPGSGRSNAAIAFAAALQCEEQPPGCGVCHSCHTVLAGSHADVTVVRTEKLSHRRRRGPRPGPPLGAGARSAGGGRS